PRSVWDLLARSAPALADWAAYFAGGARERAAVEASRAVVSTDRADAVVVAAEDFQDAVRRFLVAPDVPRAG
ncbi:SAV_6107 family HEPN domain-containing protein, partial [Cellulomonas bogoriensis]|uniref:SAV_6107 family HEPN domain-containing protein n=1 Tax=Cellulomonas bogoriensis TaxID=301388 RepID=UPI0005562A0F